MAPNTTTIPMSEIIADSRDARHCTYRRCSAELRMTTSGVGSTWRRRSRKSPRWGWSNSVSKFLSPHLKRADVGVRPTIYADARKWENYAALGTLACCAETHLGATGREESRPSRLKPAEACATPLQFLPAVPQHFDQKRIAAGAHLVGAFHRPIVEALAGGCA